MHLTVKFLLQRELVKENLKVVALNAYIFCTAKGRESCARVICLFCIDCSCPRIRVVHLHSLIHYVHNSLATINVLTLPLRC